MAATTEPRRRSLAGARSHWPKLIAAVSLLGICSGAASAATDGVQAATPPSDASSAALLRKLEAMERRIQTLEGELKHRNDSAEAGNSKPTPSADPASGSTKRNAASQQDAAAANRDKRQQKAKTPAASSGTAVDT